MPKTSQSEFMNMIEERSTSYAESVMRICAEEHKLFSYSNEIFLRVKAEQLAIFKKDIKNILSEKGNVRKERAKKKDVSPGSPSKPKTAYMIWCGENRASLKKENPSMSNQDITRLLAEKWKSVDKSQYESAVSVDKTRFMTEMSVYKSAHESDSDSQSGTKRPAGPYILYLQQNRKKIAEANPHLKGKELVSFIGASWKQLSEDDQNVYKQKSKKLMENYKQNKMSSDDENDAASENSEVDEEKEEKKADEEKKAKKEAKKKEKEEKTKEEEKKEKKEETDDEKKEEEKKEKKKEKKEEEKKETDEEKKARKAKKEEKKKNSE